MSGFKNVFIVGDLAAIEARVLAWVAGQAELVGMYKLDADVYSAFASSRFKEEVRKPKATDTPAVTKRLKSLRGVGKIAILGLGYGMGALKHLNQLRSDKDTAPLFDTGVLSPAVCRSVVKHYRDTYPEIPALWAAFEAAFRMAIQGQDVPGSSIRFTQDRGTVLIYLPSGRALRYPRARLETASKTIKYLTAEGTVDEFTADGDQIVYGNGTNTYGGKITENVVQAIARDLLAESILRVEAAGRQCVFHCHDEIVLECAAAEAEAAKADLLRELTFNVPWSTGLPLGAEVEILERYDK